jgi:glutathione S-transferase
MAAPIVYGPSFSTCARSVRRVLEEKGVEYKLKPGSIMSGEGQAAEHISRHPFDSGLEHRVQEVAAC